MGFHLGNHFSLDFSALMGDRSKMSARELSPSIRMRGSLWHSSLSVVLLLHAPSLPLSSFFVCFWAGSCCINFSASKLRQPVGLWCHRPALPHLAPVSRTRFVKLFGLLLISSPHMIQYAPCGYKLWSCSRKTKRVTKNALWLVSMVSLLVLDTKGQAEYCSPFLSFNILIISYQ